MATTIKKHLCFGSRCSHLHPGGCQPPILAVPLLYLPPRPEGRKAGLSGLSFLPPPSGRVPTAQLRGPVAVPSAPIDRGGRRDRQAL